MLARLKYLDDRLAEGSTWSTILAGLVLLHMNVDTDLWKQITAWGMAFAGALGILLKDRTAGVSMVQTITDTLAGAAKQLNGTTAALLFAILATMVLAACGSQTGSQNAAEAAVGLTAVEQAELEYVQLPACPVTVGSCKDTATVATMKRLDNVAYAAVKKALASGDATDVVAANAAIAALQAAIPLFTPATVTAAGIGTTN
jgi:hypothetical protein